MSMNNLWLLETDLGKRYWRYNDSDSDESRSNDLRFKLNDEQIRNQFSDDDEKSDFDVTLKSIGDAWEDSEDFYVIGTVGGDPIVESYSTRESAKQALAGYESDKHETGFTGDWFSAKAVFENSDLLRDLIWF